MTKKDEIKSKINGYVNPEEYIDVNNLKDKIHYKKFDMYKLKRNYYIQAILDLFYSHSGYTDMLFELLEEEHFMYIYKNVLRLKDIKDIENRPAYCKDYRSNEQLLIEMITATIDEALTIIDFRIKGKDTHFNPDSTHTITGELNGEADLVVFQDSKAIYLEQQTVTKKNDVIILKYDKYKKLKNAVNEGKTVYLLTKYIDLATNKVKYHFTLMNQVVKDNAYTYVHNPKEEDTYYKQWVAFGRKAIIILKEKFDFKPL